jgi:DNA-directed RNA polymerase subunit RPC12/RpoP
MLSNLATTCLFGSLAIIVSALIYFASLGRQAKRQAIARRAPDAPIKCPYCGSSNVHAEKRGFNLLTGFARSRDIILTCLRCNNRFQPGQGL